MVLISAVLLLILPPASPILPAHATSLVDAGSPPYASTAVSALEGVNCALLISNSCAYATQDSNGVYGSVYAAAYGGDGTLHASLQTNPTPCPQNGQFTINCPSQALPWVYGTDCCTVFADIYYNGTMQGTGALANGYGWSAMSLNWNIYEDQYFQYCNPQTGQCSQNQWWSYVTTFSHYCYVLNDNTQSPRCSTAPQPDVITNGAPQRVFLTRSPPDGTSHKYVVTFTFTVTAQSSQGTDGAGLADFYGCTGCGVNLYDFGFVKASNPAPPTPVFPLGGGAASSPVTLYWNPAPDPLGVGGYWVDLSTDPNFAPASTTEFVIHNPYQNYQSFGNLAEGTYYWRVREFTTTSPIEIDYFTGDWSTPISFIVDNTPPGAPTLVSPSSGSVTSSNEPTISWNAATDYGHPPSGVAGYVIEWDTSSSFSSTDPNLNIYPPPGYVWVPTSATFGYPLSAGTWYWRVFAVDYAANVSPPSSTFSFIVPSPADFSLASTTPATTNAGSTVSSTITVSAAGGFSGTVSLTDTVPSNLSCGAISPGSVTGSGTATLSCSSTVAGTYSVSVTGTSNSITHSITVTFTVTDFTTTASAPPTVSAATSAATTITVTAQNGFKGTVNLSDTVPANLSCGSISPTSLTNSGTATLSCSSKIAGNYSVTITGSMGGLSHSTTVTFKVTDFTISATSPAAAVAGTSATSTITVGSLNGFSSAVSFTATVPANLNCGAFSPASVTGSGTATLSCSSNVPGTYVVTIKGSSPTTSHTTTATFTITDFSISSTQPTSVLAGVSSTSTITVAPLNGFTGTVSLSDSVPAGLTCNPLSPASITNQGTASLSCSSTTAGTYSVTVTGTSGTATHSTTVVFTVTDFSMSASSPKVTLGVSGSSTITVGALNGFTGTVTLSDTVPAGLTCNPINPGSVTNSGTATLSCSSTTIGSYTVTITGSSGSLTHTTTATFSFTDFTVAAGPATQTVSTGSSASSAVTLSGLNGFSGTIGLQSSAPANVNCSINLSSVSIPPSPNNATMSCSSSVSGDYSVSVTATSGTLTHTVTIRLIVGQSYLFQDSFNYGRTSQMPPIGYNSYGIQSIGGGILALTNDGNTGSFAYWTKVTPGTSNWTITENVEWTGGNYGTLHLDVYTASHNYIWGVDGYYQKYIFYRDGSYTLYGNNPIQAGVWHTLRMDMVKGTFYLYFDGNLITTYSEASTNNSLTQFGPSAGWESADSFNFLQAAAFVSSTSTSPSSLVTKPAVTTQPFAYPWDGSGFYAQGRDWVFYVDSGTCSGTTTNCLYYATSTNGATWSTYNIGVASGATPSVVANGTNVFYARYNGLDTNAGQALMFRVGALHADGTIGWQPETTVKPGSSGVVWYSLSLGITTTGQAFVAYEDAGSGVTPTGGGGFPHVIHSNGRDYTTWQQETLLVNSSDNWRFTLVPLPSGQLYIFYWPYWAALRGQLWNSTAWGAQETITPSNTYVQQYAFGFSPGNSTVYVIYQERYTQKIQFASRTCSPWCTPQTIAMSDTAVNPRWTASYDPLLARWSVDYYNYTSNQIYQYSGVPGNWSGKTILLNTNAIFSSTLYIGSFRTTGQVTPYKSVLGFYWTQNPTTGLEFRFANETTTMQPRTMLLQSPGTPHPEWPSQLQNWVVAVTSLILLAGKLLSFERRPIETRLCRFRSARDRLKSPARRDSSLCLENRLTSEQIEVAAS